MMIFVVCLTYINPLIQNNKTYLPEDKKQL